LTQGSSISEGLYADLPADAALEGITERDGLFLITRGDVQALLPPGCRIVESGVIRVGGKQVPIHRYVKPGEAKGNLARRAQWFQARVK
jgi:hypothetical protein